ncbi:UDP-glucose/GDP-mannose dehydrogenase family protein [Fulvimarina endophytica]|uniref:UDP-glucose 6-dehydrogenase n=1 Tax=Fulvimarina endophytica TaxID=2293836 RepID=A0A371X4N0_9HYPH|nr:UDP-glucose/GDP-mannose dehydrogenase family protein [Fulvimarina endophytica]RFC64192.1 UDP-glucose/GDP-mannose dehydrogenase family protein [Fulvimarina endophytica]
MKIAIVGAGYVGLVSGACFADFGFEVTCVDANPDKIAALEAGKVPIYEPGLAELLDRSVRRGLIRFTSDLAGAVAGAEVIFIAVGTPSRRGDGYADLTYVYSAAEEIGRAIGASSEGHRTVVVKSTVPVGTGDEVERILSRTLSRERFGVASNPEFLREGAAIEDFKRPDRVVVGTEDERTRQTMARVYRPLSLNQAPVFYTDRRSAELTKYAANAFLATKITFINEMADLCEATGANVQDVARGIGLDRRIGPKFLNAGPGYGGSCFPKDTVALIKTAQDHGTPTRIVETVASVNEQRKRAMARKVVRAMGGEVRERTVAILGLTFKPNTDDMRDAPSIAIVRGLQDAGARIVAFDPEGEANARDVMENVRFARDPYECARGADAAVIVTEWDVLRALDLDRLKAALARPVLVDLRNVYEPEVMRERGFAYTPIGRVDPFA